jgi:hypothetical protein
MFPAKAAGLALVILRVCVALQLIFIVPALQLRLSHSLANIVVGLFSLGLCVGAATPAIAVLCVLLQLFSCETPSVFSSCSFVVPLALPFVLMLLGPGAYSFDAKRYGRRVISGPRR